MMTLGSGHACRWPFQTAFIHPLPITSTGTYIHMYAIFSTCPCICMCTVHTSTYASSCQSSNVRGINTMYLPSMSPAKPRPRAKRAKRHQSRFAHSSIVDSLVVVRGAANSVVCTRVAFTTTKSETEEPISCRHRHRHRRFPGTTTSDLTVSLPELSRI